MPGSIQIVFIALFLFGACSSPKDRNQAKETKNLFENYLNVRTDLSGEWVGRLYGYDIEVDLTDTAMLNRKYEELRGINFDELRLDRLLFVSITFLSEDKLVMKLFDEQPDYDRLNYRSQSKYQYQLSPDLKHGGLWKIELSKWISDDSQVFLHSLQGAWVDTAAMIIDEALGNLSLEDDVLQFELVRKSSDEYIWSIPGSVRYISLKRRYKNL